MGLIGIFLIQSLNTAAPVECKTVTAPNACAAASHCTWMKPYKRKSGEIVAAHCGGKAKWMAKGYTPRKKG